MQGRFFSSERRVAVSFEAKKAEHILMSHGAENERKRKSPNDAQMFKVM